MCGKAVKYFVSSLLLVSAAVGSEVKESHAPHPCCGSPTIEFNEHCNTSWSEKSKTFAISNGASTKCFPPCMKIENGQMTVDKCVNITAAMVCSDENNLAAEERIYYYVQPCSDSPSDKMAPGNQGGSRATGSVGLLLLALVIVRKFV